MLSPFFIDSMILPLWQQRSIPRHGVYVGLSLEAEELDQIEFTRPAHSLATVGDFQFLENMLEMYFDRFTG